ncbi:UPF0182 protein [Rhizoctonia solani]|uniref:UPF0182 protein n=1 Tax=Rhizoctonia solani TaxID=456999 RepID=A0A0K6FXS5_9AGAM|nr:UPF0182 protein [Rhizoctonia solani]
MTNQVPRLEGWSRIMVITGGSGLLGSYLARFYHNRDFHVRIVDIRPPPECDTVKYYTENLIGNLCDLDFCKYAVRGAEIVLHCAEIEHEDYSYSGDNGTIDYQANHTMTHNLLACAHQARVQTFFYASTYIEPNRFPPFGDRLSSNDRAEQFGPETVNLSQLEKLHSEQLTFYYSSRMIVKIARLANIYGPSKSWDSCDRVGPVTLVRQALAAKLLIGLGIRPMINLAGEPIRKQQFVHIDDAVEGIVALIEGEKAEGSRTVIPNQSISTLELASLAMKVVGLNLSQVDVVHNNQVIDLGDINPDLDSTSRSSGLLARYQHGLTKLRYWMETRIYAQLNQNANDRDYLTSLLSPAPANRKPGTFVKFAVLVPPSLNPYSDSTLNTLTKFAHSLQAASWRDRNELGSIRYDLSIYLTVTTEDESLFASFSPFQDRAELIFHEHGLSRVFIVSHSLQKTSGAALNNAAHLAYLDRCDYYAIMESNIELLDEGWMRLIHAKFESISMGSGGPGSFGCVTLVDSRSSGTPSCPVIHRIHMDIFKGELIPEMLDTREADRYLFQLYRHFGAADTIPSRVQSSDGIIHEEKHNPPKWTFDTFEVSKARIQAWVEQNSLIIQPTISLDVIVPSYRVSLERISRVLALKPSSTCITMFIIVVDNPRSPYVYELKHSNSHRTDVLILVNQSNRGASASRNRGLAASTAEWVAFLDDDVDPNPNYLVAAEHYIRSRPDAAGFVGNTYFPAPHNIFTTAIQLSGVTFFWDIADKIAEDVPWGITANLIVRRNVRDQIKFDLRFPKTGGGEDIDFCINKRKASIDRGGTGFSAAPGVIVTHPWWNGGHRSYTRFFNWARGDGALIRMHPDLSWRDITLNSAETFLLAALFTSVGLLFFSWRIIRFGIILAISTLVVHVLHDAYRHLFRQMTHRSAGTRVGHLGWVLAICEGALIRVVSETGRLMGVIERNEWESIGERFDWFNGGPWGVIEERAGGIERAVLTLGVCIILMNIT